MCAIEHFKLWPLYVRNYMDWAYKNNTAVFLLQNTSFCRMSCRAPPLFLRAGYVWRGRWINGRLRWEGNGSISEAGGYHWSSIQRLGAFPASLFKIRQAPLRLLSFTLLFSLWAGYIVPLTPSPSRHVKIIWVQTLAASGVLSPFSARSHQ